MGTQPHLSSRMAFVCGSLIFAACGTADAPAHGTPSGGRSGGTVSTAAGSGTSGVGVGSLNAGNTVPASGATGASGTFAPAGRGAAGVGPVAGAAGMSPRGGAGTGAAGSGAGGATQPPGPPGTWPAADPGKTGPFATVTENMVGPGMAFTMFRPKDLTQRHPVITWGNGTGTTPPTYRGLLTLYASHGFIVIASNSMNVGQGTPPPMLDGVTWVLEQDMTQGTALYQHVDRDRIGATGHSQGAFAASSAGTDARIKTIAPIETLGASRGLHGPVLGLCGSMDTTVPCSGNMRSFTAITDQPVMYAELTSADHTNWIFSATGTVNPYWMITNAWFRVQLMNDTALRPMFYGDCSICKDTATWVTMRKMMDQ
jgi:hypothetical protein